jgi:glycosyltransferase involved in cell wall biosynthesis
MIYLTYNDPPSGIYSSQVIDVCDFWNGNFNAKIRLVAIISLRNFFRNKKAIKQEFPSAVVIPMFPGVQNWRWNFFFLFCLFVFWGKQSVISRGPFAASLALSLKKINMVKSVCFDARGAYDAEFNEYNVADNNFINKRVFDVEKNALLNSDFSIAVSHKLVKYWNEKFGYNTQDHVVIPCTVNSGFLREGLDEKAVHERRLSLGFSDDDIVFVYSGSSAAWQSFQLMDDFLCKRMKYNQKIKVLFLVSKLPANMKVTKEYKGRVFEKWLETNDVSSVLSCCDYGMLIREDSITNQVASPVKFAEYLFSGLKIIISDNIGDYPEFVQTHKCGYVIRSMDTENNFQKLSMEDRHMNTAIAKKYFLKTDYLKEYAELYHHLS